MQTISLSSFCCACFWHAQLIIFKKTQNDMFAKVRESKPWQHNKFCPHKLNATQCEPVFFVKNDVQDVTAISPRFRTSAEYEQYFAQAFGNFFPGKRQAHTQTALPSPIEKLTVQQLSLNHLPIPPTPFFAPSGLNKYQNINMLARLEHGLPIVKQRSKQMVDECVQTDISITPLQKKKKKRKRVLVLTASAKQIADIISEKPFDQIVHPMMPKARLPEMQPEDTKRIRAIESPLQAAQDSHADDAESIDEWRGTPNTSEQAPLIRVMSRGQIVGEFPIEEDELELVHMVNGELDYEQDMLIDFRPFRSTSKNDTTL